MTKQSICYPDADLTSGLSTSDILICGSSESIKRVQRALHAEQEVVPFLKEEVLRLSKTIKNIKELLSQN